MSRRNGRSSSSTHKWDWDFSSGDDGSAQKHTRMKGSPPASSSKEAVWRAAKRISAACRWLKLDLVLLAEESMHEDILD